MEKLIEINSFEDIPEEYLNTPIADLVNFHNFGREKSLYTKPDLLIGTCMDNRINLKIPENFAFVMRNGGANLKGSEFKISYALSVGKINYFALIGHTDCGMVNIDLRKDQFIAGLEQTGWKKDSAEEYFDQEVTSSEIKNEINFTLSEVKRYREIYPNILIAPLIFKVEDRKLYFIKE